MACWPAAAPAVFDPTDVVQIQATASLYHDNNLFRIADTDATLAQLLYGVEPGKKSDTARILGVGLKLDKPLSRQRVIADLNLSETSYEKNTDLDYSGRNGRVSWLWQAGNHWAGEASYRNARVLGGFADEIRKTQDLIDTDTYTLTGGYQFHPRWRVSAELIDVEATHSAVLRQNLNYDAQSAGATLAYRTPADNVLSLQTRQTDRSYPLAPQNDHTETRLNALAAWRFSGALRFDGQLGHVDLEHDQPGARGFDRDFSGVTWRAAATWDASAKFRLNLTGFKDLRLYDDSATSYIVVNSIGLSPSYAIAPKVLLQGDFSFERRDYRGSALQTREDNVRLARVAVSYAPLRYLDVTLSFEAGDRKSNVLFSAAYIDANGAVVPFVIPLQNYDYQSWFGTVRISF